MAWNDGEIECRVCSSGDTVSLMEHCADNPKHPPSRLFWCPMCGTLVWVYNEPISASDFIAPYVAFDRDMACQKGAVRLKRDGVRIRAPK